MYFCSQVAQIHDGYFVFISFLFVVLRWARYVIRIIIFSCDFVICLAAAIFLSLSRSIFIRSFSIWIRSHGWLPRSQDSVEQSVKIVFGKYDFAALIGNKRRKQKIEKRKNAKNEFLSLPLLPNGEPHSLFSHSFSLDRSRFIFHARHFPVRVRTARVQRHFNVRLTPIGLPSSNDKKVKFNDSMRPKLTEKKNIKNSSHTMR